MDASYKLIGQHTTSVSDKMQVQDSMEVGCMIVAVCYRDGKLYVAGTTKYANNLDADPSSWTAYPPRELNLGRLYPRHLNSITKATAPQGPGVYIKRPNYLTIARVPQPFSLDHLFTAYPTNLIMREVRRCEVIRGNPHPSIAVYYGVETAKEPTFQGHKLAHPVESEVIVGLCFKKYAGTLQNLVDNKKDFDAEKALNSIESGIRHLHSIGFVHCDLKPDNIFHADGEFVIGDFDSMHEIGHKFRLKGGTPGWTREEGDTAQPADDWYSFERIKIWLEKKGSGHPDDGEYPFTEAILGP